MIVAAAWWESEEEEAAVTAQIRLSAAGTLLARDACGDVASPLIGEVDDANSLASATVSLDVTVATCPKGAGTLALPRRAIAIAKTIP